MNPLIYITISLNFEISNSKMFGGEGSIGYTETNYEGVQNLENLDESFINRQIEIVANMLKVTKEEVKLISKEEAEQKLKERMK